MNLIKHASHFALGESRLGNDEPSYFIADIAASHDGSLDRAIALIHQAAEAGADAAKFQHFDADTIVSDKGFKSLGGAKSHQASWDKSVYEVYDEAALNSSWTETLAKECQTAGIDFFTSPYSYELVDFVDPFVPAYKIGSGDISWPGIIEKICQKGKPVMLASGASNLLDVEQAISLISQHTSDLVLMQCNTNYTASLENFRYINLNVLKTYRAMYPDIILGLSDHTPGHATVLGAIALGARVIEKHFTDDNSRSGPDHKFSMSPIAWKEMVDRSRELELALGGGVKKVEGNELETAVVQRRSLCYRSDMLAGSILSAKDIDVLRPCPKGACEPRELDNVIGTRVKRNVAKGESLTWQDLT